jgi:hypothetical protein
MLARWEIVEIIYTPHWEYLPISYGLLDMHVMTSFFNGTRWRPISQYDVILSLEYA